MVSVRNAVNRCPSASVDRSCDAIVLPAPGPVLASRRLPPGRSFSPAASSRELPEVCLRGQDHDEVFTFCSHLAVDTCWRSVVGSRRPWRLAWSEGAEGVGFEPTRSELLAVFKTMTAPAVTCVNGGGAEFGRVLAVAAWTAA